MILVILTLLYVTVAFSIYAELLNEESLCSRLIVSTLWLPIVILLAIILIIIHYEDKD